MVKRTEEDERCVICNNLWLLSRIILLFMQNEWLEWQKKLKEKTYSQFIAILGIFTAISFMSMESLQVLGDLFKGVYISITYVFVIIMFVGMEKVVGNGDNYNFSFEVCALVLITITALFVIGLFITGYVIPGLMILTICAIGLMVSFLATHPISIKIKLHFRPSGGFVCVLNDTVLYCGKHR